MNLSDSDYNLDIIQPKLVWETITILGIVQGVGMRPFVVRIADRLGICGQVSNAGAHLLIEAGGSRDRLDAFQKALRQETPPAARIIRMTVRTGVSASARNRAGFGIAASRPASGLVMISPDLAICPDCQRELHDPSNRRQGHALISCMHCGPRYSILQALPYDRPRTSLRTFPLCPACEQEYTSRLDRRFHAQTISCADCGPQLSLTGREGELLARGSAALPAAAAVLEQGGILAIKDIGGYHLACRPDLGETVARLRRIKRREAKPFAVLFPDLESVRQYADPDPAECELLLSPARPIVLVWPRLDICQPDSARRLHPLTAAGSRWLGAFLPAAPIQVLLAERLGPLIMTSANLSGDVIEIDDAAMADFVVQTGLDGMLAHDRPIETSLDDSVLRLAGGRPLLIRRARGFVPLPIDLAAETAQHGGEARLPPVIAAGGDLKAAAALTKDGLCYLGAPVGDLADCAVAGAWERQLARLRGLLDCHPAGLVVDRHPDYLSARLLHQACPDIPVLPVQHHHAHIASVMAENPEYDRVLGVAFDGTGYGLDGTIWGGEWLICSGTEMRRAACLRPIPVASGDHGRTRAWQSLVHHLAAAGCRGEDLVRMAPGLSRYAAQTALIESACRHQVGTVLSSSMGGLFDAACAMLGLGDVNLYEGQCAQNLEQAAAEALQLGLPVWPWPCQPEEGKPGGGLIQLDPAPLLLAMGRALAENTDSRRLALGFHLALARQTAAICGTICQQTGISTVALSGGCFQNVILLEQTTGFLRARGLEVLSNRQVSPGDGGLALGQAWLGIRHFAATQPI